MRSRLAFALVSTLLCTEALLGVAAVAAVVLKDRAVVTESKPAVVVPVAVG